MNFAQFYKNIVFLFIVPLFVISCHQKPEVSIPVSDVAFIPLPRKLTPQPTSFVIDETTKIYIDTSSQTRAVAETFGQAFKKISGIALEVVFDSDLEAENTIQFRVHNSDSLPPNPEAYALKSTKKQLLLESSSNAGLFRGLQTLLQLLPEEGLTIDNIEETVWAVPGVAISDYPEYAYRGAMLDVARHFFSVEDVKRYIDLLAMHKINTLHLHLTDDQGWRIEIKSWPDLTTIGGKTAVGGGKGGFYTQDDYTEIVSYAASKFITVIPEIDMPGHTNAALVSYPELNCDGKQVKMYTGMRVGFSSFCVDKEITYQFVDDVIKELAALTPGKYIHLGGDESHATSDEDYKKFLKRAFTIVRSHGKEVMGWEDIESAGVNANTIVQHWNIPETAIKGIQQGAKVVLSPAPKTYLDMKYTGSTRLGLKWAGTTEIDDAYQMSLLSTLDGVGKEKILGIEAPLWSETIVTMEDLEYLAFPRIIGHAELGWTPESQLHWNDFKARLKKHLRRLDALSVNYYKSPLLVD